MEWDTAIPALDVLLAEAALVHSRFPIASMLTAHLYASPSLEEVGQKLRQNLPEVALVWRQGLRPRVALCTAAEAAFMGQLLAGASLLAALESDERAGPAAPFDFQLWLPQAVQCGLLLGVCPV